MRHEIQTWAISARYITDVRPIQGMMNTVEAANPGAKIEVNDDCAYVRVFVKGNGAALRDAASALDRAGYLE